MWEQIIFIWLWLFNYNFILLSTAIFSLAVTLLTLALVPIDIFVVSYMKHDDGTYRVSIYWINQLLCEFSFVILFLFGSDAQDFLDFLECKISWHEIDFHDSNLFYQKWSQRIFSFFSIDYYLFLNLKKTMKKEEKEDNFIFSLLRSNV